MGYFGINVPICYILYRNLQNKTELKQIFFLYRSEMKSGMNLKETAIVREERASLGIESFAVKFSDSTVIDYGMIILCTAGEATVTVNFSEWRLSSGAVITLFPNDVVAIRSRSADFLAETLRYDASLLREASLQLEQTVYSQLKADRCRTESATLTSIITTMFSLLRLYFEQEGCICLDQLVMLQLKAFFLGFYDYLYRNPAEKKTEEGSPRTRELFNRFMRELEQRYRESRDVGYYASLLSISPKYLNMIAQRMTGHRVKTLIDHYVVLQIKQSLETEEKSVKQLAWDYHFSDFSFFCRYFKQHTGLTPQQFRKREALPQN